MFSLRKLGAQKRLARVMVLAMFFFGLGPAFLPQPVHAQTAPIGNGFVLDAGDLRFIFQQIVVGQGNAAGVPLSQLVGTQNVPFNPQLPMGLRTVDGSNNNLVPLPDQHLFGAADVLFPRLTPATFRAADAGTTYQQTFGDVIDSQPRIITNLIVDQSANNPAAVAAATNPCGSGGFVCSPPATLADVTDPVSGSLFIPNITPNFGLSAPFDLLFAFFGQFFDHGLDLVTKGGNGNVVIPLQPDDPLFRSGSPTNFMVMPRGQLQPGPDGILGTADDIHESMNTTTPWVDQNQTYTSHPSHQVFLRQYVLDATGRPVPDGKVLDGDHCAPRGTGIPGDNICNVGNWAQVKAQAAALLGIQLVDTDVFDCPLIVTDPYGHFKPGPLRGLPQIRTTTGLVEGDGAAPVALPANTIRTGHAFLNDIAHNAVPSPGLVGVRDTVFCNFRTCVQPPGTYDGDVLDAHFVTGDGRGNENIALTMVHNIFHAEHNRLVHYIDGLINGTATSPSVLTPAEIAAWQALDAPSGWGYGERLFQAARFVTEMEYQHLVFEEFARHIQPLINPFLGGITSINGAISAEFAHTVYRLGHSMLPERIARLNAGATAPACVAGSPCAFGDNDIRLFDAFLNPAAYNDGGPAGPLSAADAAGSIIRGMVLQVGNELDEFVTSSVRNTLVGLPLDLPAINIARGRSEGIPPLNVARSVFFTQTRDASVAPYANWAEFGNALRHFESLVNFVAAYGTDPSITGATTVAAKRNAAANLVTNVTFMNAPAATSGLNNVDFWVGGLAEKPNVFGGLLGSTFNFVFEHQLEFLQNGDRFYYLQRTDGINLRFSLEGNSFSELARRNTSVGGTMSNAFEFADFTFNPASAVGPLDPNNPNGPAIQLLADGTKVFFDPLHTGKNILFNGGPGNDRFRGDVGDDTLYGNGGDDRLDGGEGNDTLIGGDGDDILFGGNGNDVLKGGPGNDALSSGPGFGGDILIGGDGNDFLLGGDDGVEYFGGPGNDIIVDGSQRSEGMFGGPGDDWIYDGDGHDGGMFGDGGNVFDLLAGLDQVGGDDVMGGGPGQDNHFGEGGDDIFLMSEGTNKFFGDYGFDWVTQRGWASNLSPVGEVTATSVPIPGNVQLNLLAIPGVILNFNNLNNFYRFVDGASGWDANDHIIGDENTADPAAPIELRLQPQMALTVEGAARIQGLTELVTTGFGITPPNTPIQYFDNAGGGSTLVATKHLLFIGGNILLGGLGSDTIEGRGGNDLIDGDVWLNVQLRAVLNDGTVKLVNDPRGLVADVFADPQRLNPGNITIVRSIVTPTAAEVGPPDCGTAAPHNCDTAVFSGPLAAYQVTRNANGTIRVFHAAGVGKFKSPANDGTDILRNIEQLQFADQIVNAAAVGVTIAAGTPVSVDSNQPTTTFTSPIFAIPANTLLVALVSADTAGRQVQSVRTVGSSVTNGAPLVWTRATGSNTQLGDAEIWWAVSPLAQPTVTVVARTARMAPGSMTVMAFTGANPSLVGAAAASANAASGAPTVSLTTTTGFSMVVGVANTHGGAHVISAATGVPPQVIVHQFSGTPAGTGNAFWVQRTVAPVNPAGVVTIRSTYGGAMPDPWNMAAVEIRVP